MRCDYYDAAVCRSCTLLETPYDDQVAAKQARVGAVLPGVSWLPPERSREAGFRNKAKMVVGGTADAPTLGILDAERRGVDLRECGLHEPVIAAALPVLADFVRRAGLSPYDVPSGRGELKHLLVTASPRGELMVRFVLRSTEPVARIRKHLPSLLAALPAVVVASVNVLPEHKAVLEGEREILLTEQATLPMPIRLPVPLSVSMAGDVVELLLRPQSFFQTNTAVASALYAQVLGWVVDRSPHTMWDLYCGVGGFALTCAAPGLAVLGVESSAEAVLSAREVARTSPGDVAFVVGDATAYALASETVPDLVVVNPPRRGIGAGLAGWLETSGVPTLVYSSCNPETLARDLAAMPSLRPVEARLFDMFPQTTHAEVAVLLERRPAIGTFMSSKPAW